jgi:hypothetical protein
MSSLSLPGRQLGHLGQRGMVVAQALDGPLLRKAAGDVELGGGDCCVHCGHRLRHAFENIGQNRRTQTGLRAWVIPLDVGRLPRRRGSDSPPG